MDNYLVRTKICIIFQNCIPTDSLPIAFINEFDLFRRSICNVGKGRLSDAISENCGIRLFFFPRNLLSEFGRRHEYGNVMRRDDNRRIFRDVPGGLLGALLELECPESSQIDVFAIFECSFHTLHEALYYSRSSCFFDTGFRRNFRNYFMFCHRVFL